MNNVEQEPQIKKETRQEFWNGMQTEHPKKVMWGIKIVLWVILPAVWFLYDPTTAMVLSIAFCIYFCSLD